MGNAKPADPVKLFCGILAARGVQIDKVRADLQAVLGAIDWSSEPMPFTFTSYYTEEMGADLLRLFVSFRDLVDPGSVVEAKLKTNAIEEKYSVSSSGGRMVRTINLDPGYLCASRMVLATTKDFSHRIYLRDGIYAEVTLMFQKNGITTFPWTYPDYQSEQYRPLLLAMRERYMEQRQLGKS